LHLILINQAEVAT